ncbi:hypothetical protein ASG11_05730 [Sphingomonas sp. Leaf357]|uniref:hypothetical protein n=1 Tax=Sphingomonas sp. Leaf357 TaxID=1736350 RepID=UPI0006FB645E|nr:hypothetical protein [Sphingomonas sp. Leaf357]KQS03805.1 hypothetical protein ASG11_05730 [Sphingomonas sp. Leaf357]
MSRLRARDTFGCRLGSRENDVKIPNTVDDPFHPGRSPMFRSITRPKAPICVYSHLQDFPERKSAIGVGTSHVLPVSVRWVRV